MNCVTNIRSKYQVQFFFLVNVQTVFNPCAEKLFLPSGIMLPLSGNPLPAPSASPSLSSIIF